MKSTCCCLVLCFGSIFGLSLPGSAAENQLPAVSINDNRNPAGQLAHGVFNLQLEVRAGRWHSRRDDGQRDTVLTPGTIVSSFFAEAGHAPQIPGPLIRVPQGTEMIVSVHNLLDQNIFVGGLVPHPSPDGNPLEVPSHATRQVRFNAGVAGTYGYWAAPNKSAAQILRGGRLGGAFIVDPPGPVQADRIFVIQGWNNGRRYQSDLQVSRVINGKEWPYTERLHAELNQPEHWRIINLQGEPHTMHLHGFYFRVTAVGTVTSDHVYTPAEQRLAVTEPVAVGYTFDMTWRPERVGNWIFHCHILAHMTTWAPEWGFGPSGPAKPTSAMVNSGDEMSMAGLVMGITVTAPSGNAVPSANSQEVEARRHLFVRERPAARYIPAGLGFFLEGVSQ
ncbi:MAG: multicopper oxidase domain-containing protein, partial [Terriglobales bacterium]